MVAACPRLLVFGSWSVEGFVVCPQPPRRLFEMTQIGDAGSRFRRSERVLTDEREGWRSGRDAGWDGGRENRAASFLLRGTDRRWGGQGHSPHRSQGESVQRALLPSGDVLRSRCPRRILWIRLRDLLCPSLPAEQNRRAGRNRTFVVGIARGRSRATLSIDLWRSPLSPCERCALAEVARRGHVTRARVTQIVNLLLLAPDIQEEILFLPRTTEGGDQVTERSIRIVIDELSFVNQRHIWRGIRQEAGARRRKSAARYSAHADFVLLHRSSSIVQ